MLHHNFQVFSFQNEQIGNKHKEEKHLFSSSLAHMKLMDFFYTIHIEHLSVISIFFSSGKAPFIDKYDQRPF